MAIDLPKETRATAISSIERWFTANMDMRIGNMQAAELLDFFLKELAPSAYNQGVTDAQAQMLAHVNELDINCYESEFAYWDGGRRRST
ncbi:DUF2164 domain-containing protein [Rhodoferax sp. 4810]|nr:DUF2164 domain-containing protein [Rhodoferax jenense]